MHIVLDKLLHAAATCTSFHGILLAIDITAYVMCNQAGYVSTNFMTITLVSFFPGVEPCEYCTLESYVDNIISIYSFIDIAHYHISCTMW